MVVAAVETMEGARSPELVTLLAECESLNYAKRVLRMINLGRTSKTDSTAKGLTEALSSGSLYEQLLSLETCYGSSDTSIAKQLLAFSTSKHLRKRAINLIAVIGSDQELLDALKSIPIYLQVATLRRLRAAHPRRKRFGVIEKFLEGLEHDEINGGMFRKLFLLGSTILVERNLPRFSEQFTPLDWSNLAKYHPDVAHRILMDRVSCSDENDEQLVSQINFVLDKWLSRLYSIDSALKLFQSSAEKISLSRLPIIGMVRKSPQNGVRLILANKETLRSDAFEDLYGKTWSRLPMSLFKPLFERYPSIDNGWLFTRLRPEHRAFVYKAVRKGRRDKMGMLDMYILKNLPTEFRVKEARRHLKHRSFETKPSERVPYIALLPWDEALELQKPFLQSGQADIRTAAFDAQIQAAKYDSSHLHDVLQLVLSHKNEQQLIKGHMMEALSHVSPSKWKTEHLEVASQVVRNVLDTADLGVSTLHSLFNWITPLLSIHPPWAATQMCMILREHSYFTHRVQLSGQVPVKDVMAAVEEKLQPILQKLLRKKQIYELSLIGNHIFRAHVRHWPRYLDACEEALGLPNLEDSLYTSLLEILQKYRPGSLERLLPHLILESGVIAKGSISVLHVHRSQQFLLNSYMDSSQDEHQGRRDALKTLVDGFWRWTPAQQEALARILLKDIKDEDSSSEDKVTYVEQLGLLNFTNAEGLLAITSDEQPVVQEAALKALGRLDGDQGVPALIKALSDDRARIAVYALRNTLKSMAIDKVFRLLKSIPQSKITVGKETTRLIGNLGTEEAYQYLLTKSQTDLHPDIRVALYRSLWAYLDRDSTWAIFLIAANNPEPKIARGVCAIPSSGLNPYQTTHLLSLHLQLLKHPSPEVRIASLERCTTNFLPDPTNILYSRLLELISSPLEDESTAAAKALFLTYARTNSAGIGELFRSVLPDRALFKRVHDAYVKAMEEPPIKTSLRETTQLILSIYASDRFSVTRRVELMFEGLGWADIQPQLLAIIPELHADALHEVEAYIEKWSEAWLLPGESLLEMELKMAAMADATARRVALAMLVGGISDTTGWSEEEMRRLEGYKNDDSPLVQEAAWEVKFPDEDEEEDEDNDDDEDGDAGGRDVEKDESDEEANVEYDDEEEDSGRV